MKDANPMMRMPIQSIANTARLVWISIPELRTDFCNLRYTFGTLSAA